MSNTINSNLSQYLKNVGQTGKRAGKGKAGRAADPFAMYMGGDRLELSDEGLAALARMREKLGKAKDKSGAKGGQQLSDKAQAMLDKLREKYRDYDFFAVDKIDDPLKIAEGSTKKYSVIFTNDELERMAEDEEYAEKMMEQVESVAAMASRLEESGELGEGVRLRSIVISFDADGNMKLFAELEKMSEERQERMEKAKERRAEEEREEKARKKDEPPVKRARVEAASEEELLKKLLGIDWDEVKTAPDGKDGRARR